MFFDYIQIFSLNTVIFFKTRMAPAPVSARSTGKKKRVVKHQKKGKDDSFQCGICLDSSRRKKTVVCPCPGKHQFHHRCLMRWCKMTTNDNATCPMCRQEIFEFYDSLRERILKRWRCKKGLILLRTLPQRFVDDKEILLPLCIRNPLIMKNVSLRLKDDFDFVSSLINNEYFPQEETYLIFQQCSSNIRNNKEIAYASICDSWRSASYMGDELQKDKDFMVEMIKKKSYLKYNKLSAVYNSFNEDLKNDKELIQVCLGFTSKIYSALSMQMKAEPDIYNRALDRYMIEFNTMSKNAYASHHTEFPIYNKLPYTILLKETTIERIVEKDPLAIEFLPHAYDDSILKKEQYIESILRNANAIKFCSPFHFDSETYAMLCQEAVSKDGLALEYIIYDQYVTDDIALTACKQNGKALLHVRPQQRKNFDIVYAAIENCPMAFYYCDLKSNPEIVEAAVMQKMSILHRATGKLRNNFEFVTSILHKYGTEENVDDFITSIDPRMLSNRDIIRRCVELNGLVLKHCPDDVRSEIEICRLAYEQNPEAVRYMSQEIIKDFVVMKRF